MKSVSDEPFGEELSACMDGELGRSRQRFAIKRLIDQPQEAERWSRYHLIQAVMRKESFVVSDVSERVANALEAIPTPERQSVAPAWLRPLAGGAIAASVAVLALVGMNWSVMRGPADGLLSEQGFVSQTTPLDRVFTQPATPVGLGNPNDQERLQRLMLQHQQASRGAGVGVYWPVMNTPAAAENPTKPLNNESNER